MLPVILMIILSLSVPSIVRGQTYYIPSDRGLLPVTQTYAVRKMILDGRRIQVLKCEEMVLTHDLKLKKKKKTK